MFVAEEAFVVSQIHELSGLEAEILPEAFRDNLKSFSRRVFPTFKNRQEALNSLVEA
jgi:hypothetical protein